MQADAFDSQPGGTAFDTSRVTSMDQMFSSAVSFKGDIRSWDVASVTDFSMTFDFALAFNTDLSGWNVQAAEACWCFNCDAASFDSQHAPAWTSYNSGLTDCAFNS